MNFKKYYVKTYEELYRYLNESLKKIKMQNGESFRDFMKRKFTYAYRVLMKELNQVHSTLLEVQSSGIFFSELFKVYAGEDVELAISLIKKRTKQAKIIYRSTIEEFDKLDEKDTKAIEVFRSGVGRLLSLYKRINRRTLTLKEYLKELLKMPDIRGDYLVVIAGLPQVGKSTLLSKLTSARPEIGTYPFTTKTLIAGHIIVEPYGKVVLVDSPGILDSPLEEKNVIEYKAILAIKYLADHVLYLFATYPGFYYTLAEQLNVYHSIRNILGNKPITTLLSKVDLIDKEQVISITNEIEKSTGVRPIPVSALTGLNLNEVREILVKCLKDKTRYH